jgi:hypothetical protein
MTSIRLSLERNFKEAKKRSFASRAIDKLGRFRRSIFRIHVAGDFYSAGYVRKWIEIARARPTITFFAYTRSWRVPEIREALRELAKLPNVRLWYSTDACTGAPPRDRGTRSCYLSRHDADFPAYRVDLVFRDQHKSVMKFTPDGSLVCPYENGVTETTCGQCGICWGTAKPKEKPRSGGTRRGLVLHSIGALDAR